MKAITKLNRELKEAESMLSNLEVLIKKGWTSYLGDPIFRIRREVINDVGRLKKQINSHS